MRASDPGTAVSRLAAVILLVVVAATAVMPVAQAAECTCADVVDASGAPVQVTPGQPVVLLVHGMLQDYRSWLGSGTLADTLQKATHKKYTWPCSTTGMPISTG
jgi:hypothetical protein